MMSLAIGADHSELSNWRTNSFHVHTFVHLKSTRVLCVCLYPGYYFDGSNFVDSRGRRDRYHPNMDRFIQEYQADKS